MHAGQLTTAGTWRTRATQIARTRVPPPRGRDADGDSAQPARRADADPSEPARADEHESLTVLGRYRLRRRLGSGGFGTVWMGRDERLERDVAIKILPRELLAEGRLQREAHAAARLSHPAIVTLYEAAADDEGAYLVFELVRGATLQHALAAGRLSDQGILEVGIAICGALAHAHAHGVVHRDVKPSNIVIPGKDPGAAKLTDFGVARVLGGDALTHTGDLVGTAAYMSPEQAEGREAGEAADLFSLALVLYEALTGVNPVPLAAAASARTRRLALHLPPLRRQRRELPRELGQAIDLALRPRPRERGTVAELRDALNRAAQVVSDRPGVVQDAWPTRSGCAEVQERDWPPAPGLERSDAVKRDFSSVAVRAWGAAAAAVLAAWLVADVLVRAPIPPASAALLAALAVVVAPRVSWVVLAAAAVVLLATHGRPGAALAIGLSAMLPALALPGRGSAWPLAAGAPILGIIGLAGAWPALAARAHTAWQRAALGGLGWAWVLLGGALCHRAMYTPQPVISPRVWASPAETWHQVLGPLFPVGMTTGAVVWGLGALTLPALTRAPPSLGQFLAVCAWAAAVAAGTLVALRLAGAGALSPTAGRWLAGLGGCAAIALVASAGARVRWGAKTNRRAAGLA